MTKKYKRARINIQITTPTRYYITISIKYCNREKFVPFIQNLLYFFILFAKIVCKGCFEQILRVFHSL